MRFRVTHGTAGSTGISNVFLGVPNNGVNFFKFVTKNGVIFWSSLCSLYFVYPDPIADLLSLSTIGHR